MKRDQTEDSLLSLCVPEGWGGVRRHTHFSLVLSPLTIPEMCLCFRAGSAQPPPFSVVSRHILNIMQNIEKENVVDTLLIY